MKMNLLLVRTLNEQTDMYERSCFFLFPHRTYVLDICNNRLLRITTFTMSLFANNIKVCAKVEGQEVTLTSDTHVALFLIYLIANTKFKFTGNNSLKKITISTFSHKKANLNLM